MKKLSCENPVCSNSFLRYPKDILKHSYCSSSCAASVNNRLFPKRKRMVHYCKTCGRTISQVQKFCSLSCRVKLQKKYSHRELLNIIKNVGRRLGRAPVRRELGAISYTCIREFGSWNKAVIAAQFQPHRSDSQKMYKRIRVKAVDGHKCDSLSEVIIDNWLTERKISHQRDVKYPNANYKADWVIGNNIFIEYFGLAQDCYRYDISVKNKKELAKKHSIRLVEIYPGDLYPKIKLDNKLINFGRA